MIIHSDCLDYMKTLESESIDVCISSPPYNIGLGYNSYNDKRTDYVEWQKSVWNEVCRILKSTGHLFINIAPTRKDPLLPFRVADGVPWSLQNSIIWSKSIEIDGYVKGHSTPTSSKRYLQNGWEHLFHFTAFGDTEIDIEASSVPYHPTWAEENARRSGRTWRPTVNNWHIPYETVGGGNRTQKLKGDKKHPAIFPRELVKHCLNVAGAKSGHIVFDPFAGTGTTIEVAESMGLTGIGTDIDADYVEFANSRKNT